jgi:hypothetical protein
VLKTLLALSKSSSHGSEKLILDASFLTKAKVALRDIVNIGFLYKLTLIASCAEI